MRYAQAAIVPRRKFANGSRSSIRDPQDSRRIFALLLFVSIAISLLAGWAFDRGSAPRSLLKLSNLVGPTTASLLHGQGLTACTELLGTPGDPICFHGGRMPLATMVVALGIQLLGDLVLPVTLLKTLLLLLPVELAVYLVCLHRRAGRERWMAVLLLLPFGMPAFLADVVNLQVEEGYSYSFLALATAIVLFRGGREGWLRRDGLGEAATLGLAVAGLYLSKSSMAPAAAVLTLAYAARVKGGAPRILAIGLALAAPVGWATYQHHASGRYSLGTSLDGLNLHKGNNARFVERYPPGPGQTLDRYDPELNAGVHFADEWSFNDFHQRAALRFIAAHPSATVRGDLRKMELIFLSVHKIGSKPSHGVLLVVELAGMLVFRLLFCGAMGIALVWVVRGRGAMRGDGVVFLALVGSVTVVYVIGFAYTRHVSVLIFPSALMGCRVLARRHDDRREAEGLH